MGKMKNRWMRRFGVPHNGDIRTRRYFKRQAHKAARRAKNIKKESDYRKAYDLWWKLY